MSRIGKKPISVPAKVTVAISGNTVSVDGPKGSLNMTHRDEVSVDWDEGEKRVNVTVDEKDTESRAVRAQWGTTRALIQNMVTGVTEGYEKHMEISGVGWQAQLQGSKLKLQLGLANAIFVDVPDGLNIELDKSGQMVKINGCDKQAVGEFAASLKNMRKPEPYNGKGIKYRDEVIRRKSGKAFGS